MGVTDFNLRDATGFCRGSTNAFGKTGIRSADGTYAAAHIPPLRGEVSRPLPDAHILLPRPVPVHGLRLTDLSRKPAGYRNLPEGAIGQVVPSGHPWRDRPQHTGGCQRKARLAHLPRFCAQPDPSCPQAPRREHPRPDRLRGGELLCHGPGLHRLRPAPQLAPGASLLRRAGQVEPAIPAGLFAPGGQGERLALRPDYPVEHTQKQPRLPRPTAPGEVLRCRTRLTAGLSHHPLRPARADHRRTLSLQMESGAFLQMDQAAPAHQGVLRHVRERGQDPSLDSHSRLCPRRHRQETARFGGFPLRNPTDFEPDAFRENVSRSIACKFRQQKWKYRHA